MFAGLRCTADRSTTSLGSVPGEHVQIETLSVEGSESEPAGVQGGPWVRVLADQCICPGVLWSQSSVQMSIRARQPAAWPNNTYVPKAMSFHWLCLVYLSSGFVMESSSCRVIVRYCVANRLTPLEPSVWPWPAGGRDPKAPDLCLQLHSQQASQSNNQIMRGNEF